MTIPGGFNIRDTTSGVVSRNLEETTPEVFWSVPICDLSKLFLPF
jgi:hypothetical protein